MPQLMPGCGWYAPLLTRSVNTLLGLCGAWGGALDVGAVSPLVAEVADDLWLMSADGQISQLRRLLGAASKLVSSRTDPRSSTVASERARINRIACINKVVVKVLHPSKKTSTLVLFCLPRFCSLKRQDYFDVVTHLQLRSGPQLMWNMTK
jgi:hypothetical protein